MWTAVALAASLSLAPNQAGQLTLTNVRTTYGPNGITRPEGKLLPGDAVYITFDIEGVTVGPDGKVLYSMATEITDAKGKPLFKEEPRDLEVINALGGRTVPAFAHVNVGLDQPAGDYTVKVTVTDRAAKRSQSFTRNFQVQPKGFGLVRLSTAADPEGNAPASIFQAGGSLWINFQAVGFQRADQGKGQPRLTIELIVKDESGKPTLDKPFTGTIDKDVPANALSLPAQFLVSLNRPGKFLVEVKATDQLARQSSTVSFPLTVLASK